MEFAPFLHCGSPLFFPPDTLACDIQRRSSNLILTGLSGTVTNFWRGSRGSRWHDSTRKWWRNYVREREREKDKILLFSYFFRCRLFFLKPQNSSLCLPFQYWLALKCAVEYYRTSNRCFQLVIFAVIYRYFRSRVLHDSIACVVDSLNSWYRLFIKSWIIG